MSKFKMMIVGIGLVGLLGACGDSTVKVDENVDSVSGAEQVSGEVEEVSGSVGVESNEETVNVPTSTDAIYEMANKFNDFSKVVHVDISKGLVNDTNKQKYIDITTEYLNYINSIEPYEMGISDKTLEKYVWNFDYHSTTYAEQVLGYLQSNDNVHISLMKDYIDDVVVDLNLLTSILEPTN